MINKTFKTIVAVLSISIMLVGCTNSTSNSEVSNKESTKQENKDSQGGKGGGNSSAMDSIKSVGEMEKVEEGGYSFAIQADSHLDDNTNTDLYNLTLENIKSASPEFLIDLGDTTLVEKYEKTKEIVDERFQLAKSYLNKLGDIPLYLVNGNHDGEAGWEGVKNSVDITEWVRENRLENFPPITTDNGYSGNTTTANYYTFVKGDVQIITLDPFTYTKEKARTDTDGWSYTLGDEQYKWLVETLKNSTAKYKFVFVHNLVGGYTKDARGGAEAAEFFEWGGSNRDGSDGFSQNRPGWEAPIHDLLVKYGVNAVFHGHDHFFANQSLDGITYQLVPQPGTPGNSVDDAEKFSYKDGVFLPSAGYMRVVVGKEKIIVEYIRTSLNESLNNQVVYSFSI